MQDKIYIGVWGMSTGPGGTTRAKFVLVTHLPTGTASDTFIPILAWPGRRPALGELSAWYEALAEAIGVTMPVDLVACWLLPTRGGSVLVGPPGLAASDLPVPVAEPLLGHEGLFALEDRLRAAGYRSAMAVPIRSEVQDVGMLAIGAFAADAFSLGAHRTLTRIAAQLGPSCRRLAAEPWIAPARTAEDATTSSATLTGALLDAMDRARTGADLVQLVSDALSEVVPHDRLDIIAVAPAPDCWAQLSQDGPRRYALPSAAAIDGIDALVHHLGHQVTACIPDLAADELVWPGGPDRPGSEHTRALLGARLSVGGEFIGWLWLGSESREWFREEDQATVRLAARLVSGRVAAWGARLELAASR
jgi:GAF domain-containing protein